MQERANEVTMKGNPLTLLGSSVQVGQTAPDFTVVGNDLSEVKLSDFKGSVIVVSVVPSLDTPVCDIQTRKFNEEAAKLNDNVVILTISMDLPFAQSRWCGAAGVEQVKTLSDYQQANFGTNYGLLIKGLRLLARAVLVIGPDGKVQYVQVVSELTDEPDYEAAIAAVKKLV